MGGVGTESERGLRERMSLGRGEGGGPGKQAVVSARRRNSKTQEKEKEKGSRSVPTAPFLGVVITISLSISTFKSGGSPLKRNTFIGTKKRADFKCLASVISSAYCQSFLSTNNRNEVGAEHKVLDYSGH